MVGEPYGSLESKTRRAFIKIDKRLGVSELNSEITGKLRGYSENVMRVLGGVAIMSTLLLFVTGLYLTQHHALLLTGPLLLPWTVPFMDYAESLYCWAANALLLFETLIMIRGGFYAMYKSHGNGFWFAALGMLTMTFMFMLTVGVYEGNATCVHLLQRIFFLLGLSQFQNAAIAPGFGLLCLLASALFYVLFMAAYIDSIKKYGRMPVPAYDLQIKARKPVSNFKLGAFTIFGTAFLAYAVLGVLSLASLSLHGIVGAYNTNTFKELWMTYPIMTLGEYFGDIGVFVGLLVPFVFLSLLPFIDRNLFTSWKRRKLVVALGMPIMVAYVVLGFMSMLPSQIDINSAGIVMHSAPAFMFPELPWIMLSLVASGAIGAYLLKKRKGE
jgi:quinol-cytochrome oxidoreductase complex cytochrome b subunit